MDKEIKNLELKRQTYYLTEELIKSISLMSAYEDKEKSQIVREALEEYISKEYQDKAEETLKEKKKGGI